MKVFEQSNEKIDLLEKIYSENPYHARVMYHNTPDSYKKERLEIQEKGKFFEILKFRKSVGITKQNRIFRNDRVCEKIIYDGKFWFQTSRGKKNLDGDMFMDFININDITDEANDKIYEFVYSKVPWLKYIVLNESLRYYPLNKFVTYKLFSLRVMLKHFFEIPLTVADALISDDAVHHKIFDFLNSYRDNTEHFHNIQNLGDIMHYERIDELIEVAKVLGKQINCRWTSKRAATQLQRWDHEASMIIVGYEVDEDLNPDPIFIEFEKTSGFKLLRTRREMIYEGLIQHNCISTYVSYVKCGRSGIFHHDGYTIEMVNPNYKDENVKSVEVGIENAPAQEVVEAIEEAIDMAQIYDEEPKNISKTTESRIRFSQIRKAFNEAANTMMHNFIQTIANGFNGDDPEYNIMSEIQMKGDELVPEPGIPYPIHGYAVRGQQARID